MESSTVLRVTPQLHLPDPAAACARCATDAAREAWHLLQQVVDRLLPAAPPAAVPTPVLDHDALTALVTQAASQAAREAAREAIAELLGNRPDLRPVPASYPPVSDIEVVGVPQGPWDYLPGGGMVQYPGGAVGPAPEPVTEPQAELEVQLTSTVARIRDRRNPAVAEADAAADLWISEHVTTDGAGDRDWVSAPDLLAAYDAWRPTLDAPAISKMTMGHAMRRAGHTNRRQASRTDAPQFRVGPKPMLYFGIRLRTAALAPAPVEDDAPKEPEPAPAWMSSPSERKREDTDGYAGQWPGREIPADFRNSIVVPILRSGKGWEYRRNNGNSKGKPRLISPEGRTFVLPNTPSDWRALKNTAASLRKLGAVL